MKRSLSITLAFLILITSSFTPKSIEKEQTLSKVERLYLTCKVWGFLKYYHPKIGTGVYNWDDKLLGVLKNTSNITTYEQLNTYMYRWIYAIGPRKPCVSCKKRNPDPYFLKNFDLSWTQGKDFSEELRKTFKDIETNRFEGDHHYIGKGKTGQFEPKNEEPQYDLSWADEHQRLLPLFRFWNYVEYFYPYKYQTDQDWDEVLREMIATFLEVNSKLEFHQAMLEMVVKLDDSQAGLVTPTLDKWPYYNYLPVRIEMIEGQAVVTEIIDVEKARSEDLQLGDVITSINGQSVQNLHESQSKYIWGSNEAVKERSIFYTLFMGMQESPEVTIQRAGLTNTKKLNLFHYSEISYGKSEPKEKWSFLHDSIGYVNMGELRTADVEQMMSEMMDASVIIIDIRNQPKGTYKAIAKYLLPSKTSFAVFTKPDFSYPGKFIWDGERSCGEENPDFFKGKVILLVDENTQNHAELSCMCLQSAPNVVTIGSQTAGTNGPQSKLSIYGKYYSSFTGTGVFYYDEKEVQRVGIAPDIYVDKTISSAQAGEDDVLLKAMEVAKEELALLRENARLIEQARLDSLQMISIPMDSLAIDSIGIERDNKD